MGMETVIALVGSGITVISGVMCITSSMSFETNCYRQNWNKSVYVDGNYLYQSNYSRYYNFYVCSNGNKQEQIIESNKDADYDNNTGLLDKGIANYVSRY